MVVLASVALRGPAFTAVTIAVRITALAVTLAQHGSEFRREPARGLATTGVRETIFVATGSVQHHVPT